jgi:hypothetical protein
MIEIKQTKSTNGGPSTIKVMRVEIIAEMEMGNIRKPLEYIQKHNGEKRARFVQMCRDGGLSEGEIDGLLGVSDE